MIVHEYFSRFCFFLLFSPPSLMTCRLRARNSRHKWCCTVTDNLLIQRGKFAVLNNVLHIKPLRIGKNYNLMLYFRYSKLVLENIVYHLSAVSVALLEYTTFSNMFVTAN